MTKFDAATAECQQLAQAYYQLPTVEQKIIQLFAVIYEPINRTAFLTCLNQSGCRNENGKAFIDSTLKLHIDKLLTAGLLIQERGQGPQCHRLLTEIATRHAVKIGTFETLATITQERIPIARSYTSGPRYFQNQRQFMRELRIGIYRQDLKFMNQVVEDYYKYANKDKIVINDIFNQIFYQPFDADWFSTLNQELYETALLSILRNAVFKCYPVEEPLAMLKAECTTSGQHCSDYLQLILTEQLLLRGCLEEAQQALERISDNYQDNAAPFWAWLYFFRGENEKALTIYTKTLTALKKAVGKNQAYFKTIPGIFFILVLLKDGSLVSLKEAEEYVNLMYRQSEPWLKSIYPQLKNLLQVQQGNIAQKNLITSADIPALEEGNSLATLLSSLCLYWVDADRAKKRLPKLLEALYQQAVKSNYQWLAMESAELLSRLKPHSSYSIQAEILRSDSGIQSIVDTIRSSEPWELCLNALANIYKEPVAPVNTQTELRLAWFITFSPSKCLLQPREQKMSKSGWGKGRPIALKRLSSNLAEFDYITPQDMRVCSYIESYLNGSYGYRDKTDYRFNEKAICALIGHPLVFWEDAPNTRVEIVKGESELIVKKGKPDRLILEFSPKLPTNQDFLAIKETLTRIKVIEINAEHRRIAEIIGQGNRLEVPAFAQERVLAAIKAVSSIVTVHSDIGGEFSIAQEVPAQTIPHLQLLPAGVGLKVALLSRPFAQGGSPAFLTNNKKSIYMT